MKNDFKSFLAVEFSNYLQLLLSAGRSTHNHEIMLRIWILLLQNHTSKNVSVKALSTNGFLRYVVQAQIK